MTGDEGNELWEDSSFEDKKESNKVEEKLHQKKGHQLI